MIEEIESWIRQARENVRSDIEESDSDSDSKDSNTSEEDEEHAILDE